MGARRHVRYHSNAWQELRELDEDGYAALRAVIKDYERGEELPRHVKQLTGTSDPTLYELRNTAGQMEYRAIFALDGNYSTIFVILCCFNKKGDGQQRRLIKIAKKRWKDYLAR